MDCITLKRSYWSVCWKRALPGKLAICQKIEEGINFNLKSKLSERLFHQSECSKGQIYPGWLLLCFWRGLALHVNEGMWCLTKKGLAAQIQQAPFSSWKRNRWCSQVQSAGSYFLPRVPLRQIPCSLFEFVLAGLSHCKQRSVTAHTIACVGWGLWGTAVGRWAINTHSPGAQSLLYSSVKIQLSWHYFQRFKVAFFFLETVCAYVTKLT